MQGRTLLCCSGYLSPPWELSLSPSGPGRRGGEKGKPDWRLACHLQRTASAWLSSDPGSAVPAWGSAGSDPGAKAARPPCPQLSSLLSPTKHLRAPCSSAPDSVPIEDKTKKYTMSDSPASLCSHARVDTTGRHIGARVGAQRPCPEGRTGACTQVQAGIHMRKDLHLCAWEERLHADQRAWYTDPSLHASRFGAAPRPGFTLSGEPENSLGLPKE